MTGHSHSDATKLKLSLALTGMKRSIATREKLALYPRTLVHRQHIAEAIRGESHWNWKGGITPENRLARKSIKYKEWREAVFKRDDYTCQECGKRGCEIQADHIKPFAIHPSLRFDVSNGRTLCVPCHKNTDTYGRSIPYLKAA